MFDPEMTVLEHVLSGDSVHMRAVRAYAEALQALELLPDDAAMQERLVRANQRMDELEAWGLESEAKTALIEAGYCKV